MSAKCPLVGDPCWEHGCTWYIHLLGRDPQTGKELDKWGCSIAYMPLLLVENANQVRHSAAAVESFRNNMVSAADQLHKLAIERREKTGEITHVAGTE